MTISAALQEVYASNPTDKRYIETLEVYHPLFRQRWYLTNDVDQEWDFSLEDGTVVTFQRVPFQIVLPRQDGEGRQDLQITVDDVTHELFTEVETASADPHKPITLTFRPYLNVTGSMPQMDPPLTLTISNISFSRGTVTAIAMRADVLNKRFPGTIYRVDTFPGLHR